MGNFFFINWPKILKLIFRVRIYIYLHTSRKKLLIEKWIFNLLKIWRFIEVKGTIYSNQYSGPTFISNYTALNNQVIPIFYSFFLVKYPMVLNSVSIRYSTKLLFTPYSKCFVVNFNGLTKSSRTELQCFQVVRCLTQYICKIKKFY